MVRHVALDAFLVLLVRSLKSLKFLKSKFGNESNNRRILQSNTILQIAEPQLYNAVLRFELSHLSAE